MMNRLRKTKSSVLTDDSETSDSKYVKRRLDFRRAVVLAAIVFTVWFTLTHTLINKGLKQWNQWQRAHEDHGLTAADVLSQRTVPVTESFQGHTHYMTPIAAQQVENYKKGTALIVNVHLTHHGGTYACNALGKAPGQTGSPSFACMGIKDDNVSTSVYPDPQRVPWKKQDTSRYIEAVRPHFHFLSWEFGAPETALAKRPLSEADWENPNMVSILVMREPLSRLLAIDGWVRKNHPTILARNATRKEWIAYATTPHNNTNNFALAILAGSGCCQGKDTKAEHLVAAKKVVSRMTFVLNIACLHAGLEEVAHVLGFEARSVERRLLREQAQRDLKLHRKWPSPKERLPPKIYDFLVERNRLDIELYEWSREISLVHC